MPHLRALRLVSRDDGRAWSHPDPRGELPPGVSTHHILRN